MISPENKDDLAYTRPSLMFMYCMPGRKQVVQLHVTRTRVSSDGEADGGITYAPRSILPPGTRKSEPG